MRRGVCGAVLRFEVRAWWTDVSLSLAFVVWAGLLTLACFNGWREMTAADAARSAVLAADAERYAEYAAKAVESTRLLGGREIEPLARWVQHGPTHPAWLGSSWGPRRALRPVSPLGGLMTGNVDVAPGAYSVSTDVLLELSRSSTQTEHPVRQIYGRVDVGFLTLYCLPLLLIAIGADLVAGDRERGILRLISAQGVSPGDVALVRWVARAAVPIGAVIATTCVAGLAAAEGDGPWSVRALWWTTLAGAYGMAWASWVFAVASLGGSRAVTTLRLVGLWVGVCLILPATVQAVVMHEAPVASRAEYFSTYRAADAEVARLPASEVLTAFAATRPELIARYPTLLTQAEFPLASAESRILIEARQQAVADRVEPVAVEYAAHLDRRRQLARRLSWLSPMTAMYDALTTIAGTGDDAQNRFAASVRALHERWRAFFLPRIVAMTPLTGDDYARLPDLEPSRERAMTVVVPTVPVCAGAVMLAIGLVLAGRWRIGRL